MDERRYYERVQVQNHPDKYDCSIELDGYYYLAKLIDLSKGGARLKLPDYPGYNMQGKTGAVKNDFYGQPYIQGMEYTVAWNTGDVLGIAFKEPISYETGELYSYYGYA